MSAPTGMSAHSCAASSSWNDPESGARIPVGTLSVAVDIAVEDPSWDRIADLRGLVERAAAAALAEAGVGTGESLELSCLFAGDDAIRALNAQWRGKDKPTNVLSFPAAGPGAGPMLGDVALAWGTVAREAEAEGRRLEDHVAHLVIHGTLHLLGQDHEEEGEAEAMEALETRAMARLGLPDPYAGSVPEVGSVPEQGSLPEPGP